jgi:hypothetical protein
MASIKGNVRGLEEEGVNYCSFLHKTIFVVYTHTDTEGSSVYYLPVTMVTLGHVSRQLQTQDLIAILIRIHV